MNSILEIKETLVKIEKYLTQSELEEFLKCNYVRLYTYHFTLGLWIRNELLNEDSDMYKIFILAGIEQKDDMSLILMEWLYISLHLK